MAQHTVGKTSLRYRQVNGIELHIMLSHLDEEFRKKVSKMVRQHKHVRQSRLTKQGEIICIMQRPTGRNEHLNKFVERVLDKVTRKVARYEKADLGGSEKSGRSSKRRQRRRKGY